MLDNEPRDDDAGIEPGPSTTTDPASERVDTPLSRDEAPPAAEAAPPADEPGSDSGEDAAGEAPDGQQRPEVQQQSDVGPSTGAGQAAEAPAADDAAPPDATEPSAPTRPRRRRAATRPAGSPPTTTGSVSTGDVETMADTAVPTATMTAAAAAGAAVEAAAVEAPAEETPRRRHRRSSRPSGPAVATDAASGPSAPAESDSAGTASAESTGPTAATGIQAATPAEAPVSEPTAGSGRHRSATPRAHAPADEPAPAETVTQQPGQPLAAPSGPPRVTFQPPTLLFQPPSVVAESESVEARPTAVASTELRFGVHVDQAEPTAPRRTAAAEKASEPEDFQPEDDGDDTDDAADENGASGDRPSRRRRRGGRRRRRGEARDGEAEDNGDEAERPAGPEDSAGDGGGDTAAGGAQEDDEPAEDTSGTSRRRRRRRRRGSGGDAEGPSPDDPPNTVVRVREPRAAGGDSADEVQAVKGSTRLEAKKQRRREGREQGRRRVPIITEAEFLARRESVERVMVVRQVGDRTQIGVLEDGVLVEHYVNRQTSTSYVGNIYLGKVQNVLPSMEAAFVDIGKGRNAVLYAGEVNFDAAVAGGQSKRIESVLKSGQSVLVQVTKDPIGHKGARLTSQISLPGRYLVYVPDSSMTGISRKLPDTERARLKQILKKVVPEDAGVIVRTAAEGASEEELAQDVARLAAQWEDVRAKAKTASAPALLYGEPDLTIRVVRDIFNEDFKQLVVAGDEAWQTVRDYVDHVAPDLADRLSRWTSENDVFSAYRIDEQLMKALDRKVWLPSGGSLVIDRTEAMVVIDVNTGKFTGQGGNLEETVTRNNLEAAEEIVRQLRLRDLGGIIVVDFIDMVLESNRELVLRRLLECLGRDRTKHQVAEVTSLGLVQMTRKRVGQGLLEAFSETCDHCNGRGVLLRTDLVEGRSGGGGGGRSGRRRRGGGDKADPQAVEAVTPEARAGAAPAAESSAPDTDRDEGPTGPEVAARSDAAHPAEGRDTAVAVGPPPPARRALAADRVTVPASERPEGVSGAGEDVHTEDVVAADAVGQPSRPLKRGRRSESRTSTRRVSRRASVVVRDEGTEAGSPIPEPADAESGSTPL